MYMIETEDLIFEHGSFFSILKNHRDLNRFIKLLYITTACHLNNT